MDLNSNPRLKNTDSGPNINLHPDNTIKFGTRIIQPNTIMQVTNKTVIRLIVTFYDMLNTKGADHDQNAKMYELITVSIGHKGKHCSREQAKSETIN